LAPAVGLGIGAVTAVSYEVVTLAVAPFVFAGAIFAVKKIDDRTHYWTNKLTIELNKIEEKEQAERAKASDKTDKPAAVVPDPIASEEPDK
jgi:hypothetical protein